MKISPLSTIPFTGEALKEFIRVAHLIMFDLDYDKGKRDQGNSYAKAEDELGRAAALGWEFGHDIRNAKSLCVSIARLVLPMDDLEKMTDEEATGYVLWDGQYSEATCIAKHFSHPVYKLVELYMREMRHFETLNYLHQVDRYLLESLPVFVNEEGSNKDKIAWTAATQNMQLALANICQDLGQSEAPTFSQLIKRVITAKIESLMDMVDRHSFS